MKHPRRFFRAACLAAFLRDALGTAYTKGQIERALQRVSRTPGALTYKHASVCDQCGKTAPCLGHQVTQLGGGDDEHGARPRDDVARSVFSHDGLLLGGSLA